MENTAPQLDQTMIAEALRLQIAFGVDETISDAPINHYQAQKPKNPSPEVLAHQDNARDQGAPESANPPPSNQGGTLHGNTHDAPSLDLSAQRVFAAPQQAPIATSDAHQTEKLARSAQTIEALKTILEDFEGSALKRTAKNTVFNDGVVGSRVMLIGEAPGREEDRAGKPFIGQSGQMLDRMFAAIGLDRTNLYITNLIPWRPAGDRSPNDAEIKLFMPFLKQHITLAQPDIIVTIGAVSTKALLETDMGITKIRGQWGIVTDYNERQIPVLPIFHPAFLLRTPTRKAESWADLCALRAWLDKGLAPHA